MGSDILNQKASAAAVRSEYEQAKIQHAVDEKMLAQQIGAEVTAKLSKVKEDQLAIRAQLEESTRQERPENGRGKNRRRKITR